MNKKKKQRLPRKLKKEMKKLCNIGMSQVRFGTRKGFKMNKWTWKLFFRACSFYTNCYLSTFAEVDRYPKNQFFTGIEDPNVVIPPGYGYLPDEPRRII